jgi:hypothetical protein
VAVTALVVPVDATIRSASRRACMRVAGDWMYPTTAGLDAVKHNERVRRLQRGTHQTKRYNWVAQRSLPLLTDTELKETMPTTMDWTMRRVLRDRADVKLKRKAKEQESETKASRLEGTCEEPTDEETARPGERPRA